jgi:colicin import membrane protein
LSSASASTLQHDAFLPRAPAGVGRGLLLALAAHALLIAALTASVQWRTTSPEGIEAELWAAVPQIAAPRAAPPEPAPTTVQPPRPAPEPTPEPVKPRPPEPQPDAQITVEQAKRLEKEKRLKALEEQAKQEKLRADKLRAQKEAEQRRADEAKAVATQKLKDKQKDDKARAEAAAKKREEADEAARAEAREKQMQRIAGLAGATGADSAKGTALQDSGPSADYLGRIKGRIRPNVSFPDTLPGNPAVEIEIRLSPDGRIMSSRIVKRSGVPEWDDAVLRAIERTEVLPRNESGQVPPAMTIVYRPRD